MNGINLDSFPVRPEASSEPYWVWYGRMVPERGVHHAIAAAQLAGARLLIAGPVFDQSYFDREVAPRLGDRIAYLGHLPHAELARVIGGAAVFLCTPCWEEPYVLVVAEALACGVLAIPDDPASLARAAIVAHTLDRRACRDHAERRCDAERMIDEYEALYASLVEEAAAAGSGTRFAA